MIDQVLVQTLDQLTGEEVWLFAADFTFPDGAYEWSGRLNGHRGRYTVHRDGAEPVCFRTADVLELRLWPERQEVTIALQRPQAPATAEPDPAEPDLEKEADGPPTSNRLYLDLGLLAIGALGGWLLARWRQSQA
jgi:hypothetical protein